MKPTWITLHSLVRIMRATRVLPSDTQADMVLCRKAPGTADKLTCQQLEETGPQSPHVLGWQVESAARLTRGMWQWRLWRPVLGLPVVTWPLGL